MIHGHKAACLTDKNVELRKTAAISAWVDGSEGESRLAAIKPRLNEKKNREAAIRNHLIRLAGILAKIHSDAIPLLTNAAKEDKSTENRIAAIQELAELGPLAKDAVPTLTALAAQDARATIRDATNGTVEAN